MVYYRCLDELRDVRESSCVEVRELVEKREGIEERLQMKQEFHERNKEQLAKVAREWFAVE